MDLKHNQITVGQLLADPLCGTLAWYWLLTFAGAYLPQKKIDEVMEALQKA